MNRKGRIGCNVPCDLALEHLNRRVKMVLHHLGANIRDSTIIRAAKSIGIVDSICTALEQSLEVEPDSGPHRIAGGTKDFCLILETLLEKEIFKQVDDRTHTCFHHTCTLMEQVEKSKLISWLKKSLNDLDLTGHFEQDDDSDTDEEG